MFDEKLNKNAHWKENLDAMESLPGEVFNKEATWNKFHSRSQKKSGNKKVLWYWVAAAGLMFILFLPRFFSKKHEIILVKKEPVQQKIQSPSFNLFQENSKDTTAAISLTATENKKPFYKVERLNKIITSVDHTPLSVENIAVKEKEKQSNDAEVTSNDSPVDSQINVATIIPGKKLRVVHINEVGDAEEESSAISRKTEVHSFQLHLANQEVFTKSSASSGSTGFTILKIKNSSN